MSDPSVQVILPEGIEDGIKLILGEYCGRY
jgi:hypothetical protein